MTAPISAAAVVSWTDMLTTPRRERRGFRPSRARVPVSPPAAQRVNSVSYVSSAGIGARFSTYGTTCRIFRTCPSYRAGPGVTLRSVTP